MKNFFLVFILICSSASAQELFVATEPASNMPAHSIGARLTNNFMRSPGTNDYMYQLFPEVMFGVSKNLMIHADAYLDNRLQGFKARGAGVYAKYRFYAKDKIHAHFRMAGFARLSFINGEVLKEETDILGRNTGIQAGLVATQLLHKVALSASVAYTSVTNNTGGNKIPAAFARDAINYTVSFGKLFLPVSYTSYNQVNLNGMVELLGQTLSPNGKSYLDIMPSVQLIFNSRFRIDAGYRAQLYSSMQRYASGSFLLRFEYLFFNVL